jgi:hypothetical protein
MLGTRTSLLLATALLASASAPGNVSLNLPEPRKGRSPRNLEGEYLGQEPEEVKQWNAAVDARKAAKRERQQIRAAQTSASRPKK